MTKSQIILAFLTVSTIAGCSKLDQEAARPVATEKMAKMQVPTARTIGNGKGTIAAMVPATGKVTLDHGPIAELHWPAMTMSFGAKADMMKGFAVGDKVVFEFVWNGSAAELIHLDKQ